MVDETTEVLIAELCVVLGEDDERVPRFINQWRGREAALARAGEIEILEHVDKERFSIFARQLQFLFQPFNEGGEFEGQKRLLVERWTGHCPSFSASW